MAIDKGEIFSQSESVGRGQLREVWLTVPLTIGRKILRARQRGIEQPRVAQPGNAAMFSQTFGVQ